MPLTDITIRNAKPKEKQYKLADDRGLYLLVNKSGKYFRWDYRFGGKRKTLALGVYPDVKLKDARGKHEKFRSLLAKGIDPMVFKKQVKAKNQIESANSFEVVAREWFEKQKPIWKEKHAKTVISRLENNIFPWLGTAAISSITAPMLLESLRRVEDRGAVETAHRINQICGQVFRYAIATGRAERDCSIDLKGALSPTKPKNMATITSPHKIGQLMRAIDGYHGTFVTRCALKLAPLTFVRPGELRKALWVDINIDEAIWRIPAIRMKKEKAFLVPLSRQSVSILEEIKSLTGSGKYVFPGARSVSRPMSENTVLDAIRSLGYAKGEMTGHGFRGMASTLLHENGWPSDAIERQLAHTEGNSVKAAYNHAQHLPRRREMMQWWANYLDKLKNNS